MPSQAGESRGLTVADVASQTGHSVRRTQRMFSRWIKRGWPRVWSEPSRHGKPTMFVDRAEYEAIGRGEITESRAA
jgi:hypothetical protein